MKPSGKIDLSWAIERGPQILTVAMEMHTSGDVSPSGTITSWERSDDRCWRLVAGQDVEPRLRAMTDRNGNHVYLSEPCKDVWRMFYGVWIEFSSDPTMRGRLVLDAIEPYLPPAPLPTAPPGSARRAGKGYL